MTAEEIATKAFSDMHEMENSWEVYIKAMKEYARLLIEKDRERVADIALQYTMTLPPERRKAMERVIVDWPIQLD